MSATTPTSGVTNCIRSSARHSKKNITVSLSAMSGGIAAPSRERAKNFSCSLICSPLTVMKN
jgi:hypothetical protein